MAQSLQKFKPLSRLRRWAAFAVGGGLWLACAALAGCARPAADEPVTIQLSTWGSAQEVTVLKSLLQAFERTHPHIRVQLLHIPENYYQKLHILVAGDLAPDVIFTNSLSFPIYASHGVFRDLRPFLQADAAPSKLAVTDFYPAALQAFTWKTRHDRVILGALPRDISNLVLFYNRDLFRKAGLPDPQPGWTWTQFLDTARHLTVDADNDGTPEQFGVSFYGAPPLFWLPFVWSAGGDLFSPDLRQVVLDQPKATQGLQFYANLRNIAHVAPKKAETGGTAMSQLFLQQKIAMMVSGRWSVPVLREQATFRWDVTPLPVGPGGKSRVGIDASGYAIAAKSLHPAESWALVRFLLSRRAIAAVTASGLIVPARRDVADAPLFLSPRQAPAHGQAFLAIIADGVPTRTPPRWNELSEALGLALEPVWEGRQSAAEATRAVRPTLQRLLEDSE